jgi:hypothetical protein
MQEVEDIEGKTRHQNELSGKKYGPYEYQKINCLWEKPTKKGCKVDPKSI